MTFGQWNKDEYDTLFEVGCGTSDTDRKNAFEVRNNGIVIMQNRAKVYGEPQDPTDVVRKQELDTKLNKGLIPSEYLPSYVDDVVEYDSKSAFPAEGEQGIIYVDKSTNLTYRWSSNSNNYIMIGGGDLNLENGTGTGSIQQKGITYDKLITDYEPNMAAWVIAKNGGVVPANLPTYLSALGNSTVPTSEQVVDILNNRITDVNTVITNFKNLPQLYDSYEIDSLIAGALEGYGLTSSSDLSNTVGKVGSAAAILGAMNKAFSPGSFAGGVGCEAGDEGYPGNSVCSFAYGSNVKNGGLAAIAAGKDLQNLGDTSAVFGSGDKEYKIEGSEVDKANQRIYLDNLESAGGIVTGTGDDRVGITGINRGANNFMAGTGHYIGERATNNAVVGNQNIISRSVDFGTTANNFISGLNNYINKSQLCGIIGAINKIETSAYTILLGEGLKAKDADSGTAGVGRFNAINSNARFFVGNGASDSNRKNAFEVLKDGRAKVQSAPVDDDDVVRKKEISGLSSSNLYLHHIYFNDDTYSANISCVVISTESTPYTKQTFPDTSIITWAISMYDVNMNLGININIIYSKDVDEVTGSYLIVSTLKDSILHLTNPIMVDSVTQL